MKSSQLANPPPDIAPKTPEPADLSSIPPGPEDTGRGSPDLRTQSLHEKISACAYDLWEKHGRPYGRDEEIWLEAERQLLGADQEVARSTGAMAADALNQARPTSVATPGGERPPGAQREIVRASGHSGPSRSNEGPRGS